MALDGAFLRHIKNEIETLALNARVNKIYQPNKEEFVFLLRCKSGEHKLLISTRSNSARISFTKCVPENPEVPPMLCMLFRKKLLGSKLVAVRQYDLERVIFLDFKSKNELGDTDFFTVVAEIMGRYSNIILVDSSEKIIDSLKRVDSLVSSKRQILPGLKYNLPPKQNKLSLIKDDMSEIIKKIETNLDKESLSVSVLKSVCGLSQTVCDNIEVELKNKKNINLKMVLSHIKSVVTNCSGEPFIIYDENERPKDFSFVNLGEYDNLKVKRYSNFSELLDNFFSKRDIVDRMKAKSNDLRKQISNIISRLKKKIKIQMLEIEKNKSKDELKLFADLINANLYKIKNGVDQVTLENFYDENLNLIKIKLDPRLTPAKNSEKFYKEYKKSKTALKKLQEEVNKAQKEIVYMDSVLDEVNRATSESELQDIKEELCLQGYIKKSNKDKIKNKKNRSLQPIEYKLGEKVKILVGRNNYQNDKLTLKIASKRDLWFHVKDMPGAHTILIADKEFINDETLIKAAKIAAYHSKAQNSANVPVDFALVKDVKKPSGAKPGMVIYNNYKTLYVTPDKIFVENFDFL